ncbi:hypothetical protein [Mucilaginibacter antarcticus]|uniref:hypothetical protein n=1 Tax=Mucilaginibacter antarcticus TaxID=1855725 RepID=UPI0036364AA3
MKDFGIKFQLIIKPFLVIGITSISAYSFIHWWLFVRNEIFAVDEAILNFFVPLATSFIPVLIWLLPRLKLLDFTGKKAKNPVIGYLLMATIAIGVPTVIAQEYLISATGEMTVLTSIKEIEKRPKTKYYTLKKVYPDKAQARPNTIINTSGKYNVNYNMAVYMPCPIFDTPNAHQAAEPLAWLGIKYQKTISNGLSGAEKTQEFEMFTKKSQDDFDKRDLTTFTYLDRIGPSSELKTFADAVTFSGVYDTPFIILVPRWGNFEDRNGDKGLWLIVSLVIGTVLFILMIAAVPLRDRALKNDLNGYNFEPYKLDQ